MTVVGLVARPRFGRATSVLGARSPDGLIFTREYESWRSRAAPLLAVKEL